MKTRWRAAVAAGIVGLGVAASGAQQPYRSRTDLVSVYATVTDASGRLVPNLTKDDFEVRDNGKRQTIAYFSNDIQPITIVMMLDRSGSMEENFPLVENASERFVRELLPEDRARIGNFSRQIVISPLEFTSDREALLRVLRGEMQPIGPSPIWTAVDRGITALLHEPGRRVILLFTDGHDAPVRGQVFTDLSDVIRRSEIDEVMVYAIGLADTEYSSPIALHNSIGRIQLGSRGGGKATLVKPDRGLKKLAELSGGGYFELTWNDDLGATFARVADELHHQYALAFPPGKLDGKTHELEVKVRGSGLTARARKSYVAEAR